MVVMKLFCVREKEEEEEIDLTYSTYTYVEDQKMMIKISFTI